MSTNRPYHLFVVDDDVAQRSMLCSYLERQGLRTIPMALGEDMLHRVQRMRPDLILLDVGLTNSSGLDACRKLRAEGDRVPIILTKGNSDEMDRVLGLELGADDYMSRPFSPRELLARTRAVLRRTAFSPGAALDSRAPVLIGDLVFKVTERSLHRGTDVHLLSDVECAVLAELTRNAHVCLSRERLIAVSRSRRNVVSLRAMDAAVARLRKALEPHPAVPRYIQTVRGHGYVFVPGGNASRMACPSRSR